MDVKLYVGNLAYSTTETDLQTLFAQAGTVVKVDLIKDRYTGDPKGFGFVEMSTQAEAEKAIQMLNGYNLGNRNIRVSIARPREERPQRSRFGDRDSGGGRFDRRGGGKGGPRRY